MAGTVLKVPRERRLSAATAPTVSVGVGVERALATVVWQSGSDAAHLLPRVQAGVARGGVIEETTHEYA